MSGLMLPAYVLLRPEGVFINQSPFPPTKDLLQIFVDRLFTNEARFEGLDYACFLRLLYGVESEVPQRNRTSEVRLASSIVHFPPERFGLYKGVKINPREERAEYMFEPVFINTTNEETGNVENQATQLDFDEFVAYMWVKGVRFGIDADAVRDVINKGASTRMDFAFHLDPTDSKDAEVVEESEHLRQDNTPLILADGKADLRRAKNRFPQIAKDESMLRKIPRSLGKPGYRVTGTIIEPRIPEDLNLSRFVGEGTHIEQTPRGEVLVASIEGFLVIDHTGAIHVTTKIENKVGISAKATGDIVLTVDEYIEHGEVQEGRHVEGKHMTFLSNVFGNIVSKGGDIELSKNLSGGRARSVGGDITIKGRVINSTLEAWDGKISTEYAERSLIMGKSVSIKRAVNCEIVAEELQLGIAEGCAIAGRNLQISSTNMHKNRETIISVILPDIADYDRQIAEAKAALEKIEQVVRAKNLEIAATHPSFTKYLAMSEKLSAGTITLSPEQQAGWQQVVSQFAPFIRSTDGLMKKCLILEDEIKQLVQKRATCGSGEFCKIDHVLGDTMGRKLSSLNGMLVLRNLPETELRNKLQELGDAQERIFSGDHGSMEWHFTVPEIPA
jgi:hypothetical protein